MNVGKQFSLTTCVVYLQLVCIQLSKMNVHLYLITHVLLIDVTFLGRYYMDAL